MSTNEKRESGATEAKSPIKKRRSRYDMYAPQLAIWFEHDCLTLDEAARRLNAAHPQVKADRSTLGRWWRKQYQQRNDDRWTGAISRAAGYCRKIEQAFSENPPPLVALLMKVHHTMVLNTVMEKGPNEEGLKALAKNLRPALQWAQVQEKQKNGELAETKFTESQRTKLDAGFAALAEYIDDSPVAQAAFEQLKAAITETSE